MISKIKKPVSILLSLIMVFSLFTIVPLSASAAVGDYVPESDYLTFTAEEANSSVTLNFKYGSNFKYNFNGAGWNSYSEGTTITLNNVGDYVRFSGTGTKFTTGTTGKHFSITGKVACSGNVMSLRLDNDGKSQGLDLNCFRGMFYNCTGLTTAPDLPETDLKAGCYVNMFDGCTSLTTAPELPATTLAESCYNSMFKGCTSLTTAPELPATTLAESCYLSMFIGCTSLTTAPELWATSLAESCYLSMFSGCESLTEAPELPATTLASYCYQNMFRGTKLTEAPELPATTLASYCYSNMFRDCKSLTEAPELPATNLAQYCYGSMFYGCTSLTKAPELPATNLANSCYNNMFYGCTSLTELPALPATTLASNCYSYMFSGCSKICISDVAGTFGDDDDKVTYSAEYKIPSAGTGTTASNALTNMFLGTGGKFKGTPDINTTYYVPAPAPTTHTITWKLDAETVIDTTEVEDGVVPTHADATKDADVFNTYTFTGWTPEIVAATADATYTATFTAVPFVASVTTNGTTTGYTSFSNAVSAWNNAANGSTLTLLDNVAISNIITINGTKILDLNDHRISMTGTDAIFYIGSGANLTLEDNATEKSTHYYSAAKNGSPGSVSDTADENHPYSFTGGYITGGKGYRTGNWRKGGVAYIAGGTFTINGGTLVGNQASGSGVSGGVEGGTIYATSGSFTLNGGNILADFSSNGAGGVFLEGTATFRMNGGSIKHCYAGYGAVIRNNNSADGAVILSGGTIAENISSHGKIIASGSMTVENVSIINNKGSVRSVIYVSGSPVIKDNTTSATDNTPRNVEVPNGKMINITGELTDGAEICVTMDTPGVFTDTTDTSLNVASKFFSDKSDYIVGKNDAGQLYLSKKLIAGHTLSLDGNIAINFYLDPSAAGLTAADVNSGNLSYSFAWVDQADTKAKVDVAEQARQSQAFTVSDDGKYIIVTCHVCAAEMTCDVIASFTLGDKTESETYSVRKYCDDSVLSENAQYKDDTKLVELVKAMLNYGAMAQTKFGINTGTPGTSDTPGTPGKLANEGVTYNPGDVTGTKIDKAIAEANGNKTADDMNAVAAALGAKWFSTSLIYLDDSTLRHYFVKDTDAFNSSAYTGNKSNYYYYVEVSGIAAAELDNLQSFTAGTESFKYSALDFVKGMITSSADEDSKNLAKSLYWYNQAANEYFPAPAEKILVLDDVNEDTTVEDGYTITGTLQGDYKISIADGATVTFRDVDITCLTNGAKYAGITLAGDATINLEGANTVKGGYEDYAGVYVPEGKTLTIDGTGSLDASSNGYGCGIGAGNNGKPAGNIVINGGTITAIGGDMSAGIGGSHKSNCGDITITGGTVYAESLGRAPGIGAGHGFYGSRCGNITISGGSVTAIGESYGSGIGTGLRGVCGAILITAGVTQVTATKGSNAPNSIGAGKNGTCGTVTIENGANVTQN